MSVYRLYVISNVFDNTLLLTYNGNNRKAIVFFT